MPKRGQVSIFLILAIVVVVVVAILIILSKIPLEKLKRGAPEETARQLQIQKIEDYIKTCVEETAVKDLYTLGLQGGFIKTPQKDSLNYEGLYFSYFYIDGKNIMPSKRMIEGESSEYMNLMLPFCIENLGGLWDFVRIQNWSITSTKEISTKIIIKEDSVLFEVEYPITLKREDIIYELSEFNTEINVKLGRMYDISKKIVDEQIRDPGKIKLTFLSKIAEENEVIIDMIDYEDAVIFTISDNPKIYTKPYAFTFAIK